MQAEGRERGQAARVAHCSVGGGGGGKRVPTGGVSAPPGRRGARRLTMTTPVSLLASMMVTRHVAGRTAARMSSTSARPFTLDTGTKVTAEAGNTSTEVNPTKRRFDSSFRCRSTNALPTVDVEFIVRAQNTAEDIEPHRDPPGSNSNASK